MGYFYGELMPGYGWHGFFERADHVEADLGHFLAGVFNVELGIGTGTVGRCERLVDRYGALRGAASVV